MNRVLTHSGATYPIIQAPMGWIARALQTETSPVTEIIRRTIGGFHDIRLKQAERSRAGAF